MSKSKLVYSTDQGRVANIKQTDEILGDGNIKVQIEKKGRGGKLVTTVIGLPLNHNDLKTLAKKLKQLMSIGGTVKNGVIEIQGNQKDRTIELLKEQGYNAKSAGG